MKKHVKPIMSLVIVITMLSSGLTVFASDATQDVLVESTETNAESTEKVTTEVADTEVTPTVIQADESDTNAETTEATDVADDNVVIEADDKPYLALGADLSADQQSVVLGLMGIDASKLDDYKISYVTNAEEHEYLDTYIASSEIGSKSWSSVVIVNRDDGNGINISTKNINYCTVGMYKNALVTAGIKNADIIVAGPQSISGTAALVGIFKAYTEMTGSEISEDSIDTALNELVLTGALESSTGASADEIEELVAYLKQKVAEGALDDEESMSKAIDEACDEFNVTLTDDEKTQLIDLLKKIDALHLDPDTLLEQAQSIYDKLGDLGIDTSSGIGAKIGAFFTGIIDSVKDFFKSIF